MFKLSKETTQCQFYGGSIRGAWSVLVAPGGSHVHAVWAAVGGRRGSGATGGVASFQDIHGIVSYQDVLPGFTPQSFVYLNIVKCALFESEPGFMLVSSAHIHMWATCFRVRR